jgi:hypothetical protein
MKGVYRRSLQFAAFKKKKKKKKTIYSSFNLLASIPDWV